MGPENGNKTAKQGVLFTITCLIVLLISGTYAAFAIQSLKATLELHTSYMREREKRWEPIFTEQINTIKAMNLLIAGGISRQDEILRGQVKILESQEKLLNRK
jgi:hypothetical protein